MRVVFELLVCQVSTSNWLAVLSVLLQMYIITTSGQSHISLCRHL